VLAVPPAIVPIRVLGLSAQSVPSQAPPTAPQTPPIAAELSFPPPPVLPGLPGIASPPVNPPVPPPPPPPPATSAPVGLSVSATPVGLTIPPPASPIPPPAPPIQPAPPGGARKEARQRQAATAKSEEGSNEQSAGVDTANGPVNPTGAAFTRRRADAQPSAWVTGLEWGGGTLLMALVLALGFTTVRPTPRRKLEHEVRPAPAWVRHRR